MPTLPNHIRAPIRRLNHTRLAQMPLQPLIAMLMHSPPSPQLRQAIAHDELVVAGGEDGGGHVDEDGDPRVATIGEGLAAEEDGGDDARAQVARQVGADADVREAPHHRRVREADHERRGGGRDERVGWVERRPDDDALGVAC